MNPAIRFPSRQLRMTRVLPMLAAFGAVSIPCAASAQPTPVAGVELGQNETTARPQIDAACAQVTRIAIPGSRFPQASKREVHLRCRGLTLADGRSAGDAMFTFADDFLVMIETRGAPAALAPAAKPAAVMGRFEVYMPGRILIDRTKGQDWMLATAALAPLAFSWENPAWSDDHPSAPRAPYTMPAEIVFGATLADIQARVKGVCDVTDVEDIDDIWLDTHPARQQQLDCFGIKIGGYPRKLEFVFGDGRLEQVWILFGSGDVARLHTALVARYGRAIQDNGNYEAFNGWRIAIRKDKSEILMGSDRLAEIWQRNGP